MRTTTTRMVLTMRTNSRRASQRAVPAEEVSICELAVDNDEHTHMKGGEVVGLLADVGRVEGVNKVVDIHGV